MSQEALFSDLKEIPARLARGEAVVTEMRYNGRILHTYTCIVKDGILICTNEAGEIVSSVKIRRAE